MKHFILFTILFSISLSCTTTAPKEENTPDSRQDANIQEKSPDNIPIEKSVEQAPEKSIEAVEEKDNKTVELPTDLPPDKIIKENRAEKKTVDCHSLILKWKSVVKENRSCSKDNDCVILGFRGGCDCSYGPARDGSAVNKKATLQLQKLEKEYLEYCRSYRCIADVDQSKNLRCENGACTSDYNNCLARD